MVSSSKFESIHFSEYFENFQDAILRIDFLNRQVFILDNAQNLLSTIHFSVSIKKHFSIEDLFKKRSNIGDYNYWIYPNGEEGLNWLWHSEVIATI